MGDRRDRRLTVAAFTADGLDAATMRDFYETGARSARRTEKVAGVRHDGRRAAGEAPRRPLSDGTGQTVVAWQPADDGAVWVLLAADVGDTKVAALARGLRGTLTPRARC